MRRPRDTLIRASESSQYRTSLPLSQEAVWDSQVQLYSFEYVPSLLHADPGSLLTVLGAHHPNAIFRQAREYAVRVAVDTVGEFRNNDPKGSGHHRT